MYRHQENVKAQDRANIFGRTLTDRLTDSAEELSSWHDNMLPALKRAIKDYKMQSRKGQTTIYGRPEKTKSTATEGSTKKRAKPARRHSSGQEPKTSRKIPAEDNNAPT